MKRWVAVAVVWVVAAVAMGQSLGELSKKEKERRKKNQTKGVQVRTVTEAEVRSYAPAAIQSPTEDEAGVSEEDVEQSIMEALGGGEGSTKSEGGASPAAPSRPPAMGSAPSFSLQDRTGRTVSLRDFRGRPVLIDFWATWCGPCRSTMPEVEKLHRKYSGRGLQVVGINIEGREQSVLDYLDNGSFSFLVLFDSGNWQSVVAQQYNVSSIPRTFLVDKDGSIVFSGHPSGLKESLIEATLQ